MPGKEGAREILLTPEAVSILKPWADKYPKGPILGTMRSVPGQRTRSIVDFVGSKRRYPSRSIATSRGTPSPLQCWKTGRARERVAAILGHKDATMVLKVYGKHIEQREQHLRDCLKSVGTHKTTALDGRHRHDVDFYGQISPISPFFQCIPNLFCKMGILAQRCGLYRQFCEQ